MARTGKWPARISLALSAAMIAALFSVISASGQQAAGSGILTVGIDVQSASITQVTYDIVVRNQGNAPTSAVRVRSAVPAATTFESSEPPPTTTTSPNSGAVSCDNAGSREASGTTCEWSLGTLAGGETRTITAVYNLNQTNTASDRIEITANATDSEGHNDSDTDESLVRQRTSPSEDTWVDDAELVNTNHGTCEYLRILQGNRITSFIDLDALGTPPTSSQATDTIEQLYGAQLRLEVLDTTYSQQAPGTVGAHRITSAADWTEGGGNCQGTISTTTTDARTGGEPASAGTPTGSTPVSAAAQIVNFDVTGDLDTEAERGNFNGWELRDQTSGTGNATRFHSAESTTGQPPQVFLVFETVETATCVDADPETATAGIGNEHLMTAFVTDGAKVPPPGDDEGSETTNGQDGCNGAPVAASVEWFIEDDTPDIYFSSQEGAPIQRVVNSEGAGPNEITTTSDANGLTGAGVKLNATPTSTDNSNRIEVRLADATDADPDPPGSFPPNPTQPQPPQCGEVTVPPGSNCSGETAQYDDVNVAWGAQSGSSTSGTTGSTTTTGGSSSSASTSASASSSSSSSASASSSTSSPSRSASTSGSTASGSTGSQARSPRSVSLFPSSNEVVFPAEVTVSGQITSADNSCRDFGEFVRIQRRVLGESEYTDFEGQNTNAEGRYEISFEATESAEYIAVTPAHDQCMEATSSPETIVVKVKVTARASDRSVKRGSRVAIAGRVLPDHDGTNVVLQRKKGGRFVNANQVRLNGRSRYRFALSANWRGRRTFRVVWRSQDDEHATNNSRNIVIRTTRR